MENNLSWDDLKKSSNVCWTILIVNDFPTARNPAYQLTIDFEKLSEFEKHQPKLQRLLKEDLINRQIVLW
jgi:tRNA-binding protein